MPQKLTPIMDIGAHLVLDSPESQRLPPGMFRVFTLRSLSNWSSVALRTSSATETLRPSLSVNSAAFRTSPAYSSSSKRTLTARFFVDNRDISLRQSFEPAQGLNSLPRYTTYRGSNKTLGLLDRAMRGHTGDIRDDLQSITLRLPAISKRSSTLIGLLVLDFR